MRTQKIKSVLALLLAVMLLVSLTACASTPASSTAPASSSGASETPVSSEEENLYYNKTGYPICDDPITVTLAGANNAAYTPVWNDLLEIKRIEERFGIKLDCTMYSRDAWKNQISIMLSGDTLPDLIINAEFGSDATKYGMEGYFLALNEYRDLMPNLFSLMDSHDDLKMAMTAADGNVYSLCRYIDYKIVSARVAPLWINETWLKNVNMDVPETADELYAVLKAFKEQDANGNGNPNDEIPLGACDDWSSTYFHKQMMAMFGMFCAGKSKESNILNFYIDDNGKIGMCETTENYKAYLEYMQKLYTEGLLDAEFFTMTGAQFTEKRNANVYGMVAYSGWTGSTQTSNDVACIAGLTSAYNDVKAVPLTCGVADFGKTVVNADTKYPEAICRLLDYFMTQDNLDEFYEGIQFEWKNSTVKGFEDVLVRDSMGLTEKAGFDPKTQAWEYVTSKVLIQNGFQNFYVTDTSIYKDLTHDELVEVNKSMKADPDNPGNCSMNECFTNPELVFIDVYPILSYTSEELEKRIPIITSLSSYIDSQKAQIILGNVDVETGWSEMVKGLQAQGLDELLAIEQTAYDRAKG